VCPARVLALVMALAMVKQAYAIVLTDTAALRVVLLLVRKMLLVRFVVAAATESATTVSVFARRGGLVQCAWVLRAPTIAAAMASVSMEYAAAMQVLAVRLA